MRAGDGEYPVWQSPKARRPISNSVWPECGQFSEFARPAVNVYQKSRLRFSPPKPHIAVILVHILDAPVNPEDADPLHLGTI